MVHLSHHETLTHAAPLIRRGLNVDLAASRRAEREIAFRAVRRETSDFGDVEVRHRLYVDDSGFHALIRATGLPTGPVATVRAIGAGADRLIDAVEAVPLDEQLFARGHARCARSLAIDCREDTDGAPRFELEEMSVLVHGLALIVDASPAGGMPADAIVVPDGVEPSWRRDTLANGRLRPGLEPAARDLHRSRPVVADRPALPDDLLAVLGPQWRPLTERRDHWRTVLRRIGREPTRTARVDRFMLEAADHLERVLAAPAPAYHRRYAAERRRVYLGRLKPAFMLLAVLSVIPVVWLLVDRGSVALHPLILGIAPLLMVASVAVTAREIPILELPPWPRSLPPDAWVAPERRAPAAAPMSPPGPEHADQPTERPR